VKLKLAFSPGFVGASLLAMEVNDNAGCLNENGALTFIASKLAPTGLSAEINSNR
jgi:hypothetical protein